MSVLSKRVWVVSLILSLVALVFTAGQAQAQYPTLDPLFADVMAKPSDPAANFRYAKEAERLGLLRKALAAYERVLMNDPTNAEARAGYERVRLQIEPAQTKFTAGLGVQYDSNIRLEKKNVRDDIAQQLFFRVVDDRKLGGMAWRTAAQAYADFHASVSSTNLGYGSLQTGPVFVLDNGWHLYLSGNFDIAFLQYDLLFWSGGINATIDTRQAGFFRSAGLSVAYADYANGGGSSSGNAFQGGNGRDGPIVAARATFGFDNVLFGRDNISIKPSVVYDHARASENRFWQVGGLLSYVVLLGTYNGGQTNLFFNPDVALAYRNYAGAETGRSNDRNDLRLSPGAKLIATHDNLTFVLSYSYDRAWSNYDTSRQFFCCPTINTFSSREYENHRIGFNMYVDF